MSACCCLVCVSEMDAGVVENCGKFDRIIAPGLQIIMCPFEIVAARVSLKIHQLEVRVETKTKDNVFVTVVVAVQYKVVDSDVGKAFYKLTDPKQQIRSYVFDVVRSSMPLMDLDDAFVSKDHVAKAVKEQLTKLMTDYGYEILAALVVDLEPDRHVRDAMNEINASSRLREAAAEKAEAEKILQVKAAEAEADSKYLKGLGVAKQRKAIIDGLKGTVADFSENVPGAGAKDVMDLLLLTQYFDMMKEIGKGKSESNGLSFFLPHGPKSVQLLRADLQGNFMSGLDSNKKS